MRALTHLLIPNLTLAAISLALIGVGAVWDLFNPPPTPPTQDQTAVSEALMFCLAPHYRRLDALQSAASFKITGSIDTGAIAREAAAADQCFDRYISGTGR